MLDEKDILFDQLNSKEFEELCYDLLVKSGYHSLVWRQGGADKGRDIEAVRTVSDLVVNPYTEKWFIECKKRDRGVRVLDITEKVSWARSEKADHLLIIVSSYLTQQTRDMLVSTHSNERFKVHIIEGKLLKSRLLHYPDLLDKYFLDDAAKLVKALVFQWTAHNVLPEAKMLYKLSIEVDPGRLNNIELAFLWFAYTQLRHELDEYCRDEDLKPQNSSGKTFSDSLVPFLKKLVNSDYPIMGTALDDELGIGNPLGTAWIDETSDNLRFGSAHFQVGPKEMLQVVLIRDNGKLKAYIGLGVGTMFR